MKKNDYICLFLSIVINIAILFVLAMFLTNEIVETDEIKIGLISTESDASTRFKGEKNVNAKKQNLDADSIEKKIEEDKTQEEKPENKPIEKSEKERPEKKVEESKNAEKTVQVDDKPKTTSKKEKPSLADLKKQISNSQPKTSNGSFSPTADSDGEEIVDRVLQSVTYSNGLVSGSKMGNSEGGLLVDWNDGNRAPEFPQSARPRIAAPASTVQASFLNFICILLFISVSILDNEQVCICIRFHFIRRFHHSPLF